MFYKPTVFVLGAGASWHYGFPTGEALVNNVTTRARTLAELFDDAANRGINFLPKFMSPRPEHGLALEEIQEGWRSYAEQARQLANRLEQVNPTLIDYFLAHNERLQGIGKFVIAAVILECERRRFLEHYNMNRLNVQGAPKRLTDDDWLKFVIYKLTSGITNSEELLDSKLSFVTFNYDTSLEWRIKSALQNLQFFEKHVDQFMAQSRFTHVYGKIDSLNVDLQAFLIHTSFAGRTTQETKNIVAMLQTCYETSTGIRTIHGNEKLQNAQELELAKQQLALAEIIYILGYGFDEANSQRIGLDTALRAEPNFHRSIMFTNFGDNNRVTKAASRLMNAEASDLRALSEKYERHQTGGRSYRTHREMSTRDVYNALSRDFESLETS